MRNSRRIHPGLLLVLVLGVALGACSSDDDPVAPGQLPADMDSYLAGLPSWEDFSPVLPDDDYQVGDTESDAENVDGTEYNCTSTTYSITQTPDKIVTLNPDSEILWPGVLLQGKGHTEGIGSLAELPIRQRAPLTLSVDLLADDNMRTVDSPTLASVTQAVGELVQAATDGGHRAGSSLSFSEVTTHSVQEAAIRMGFSASYYSVGVKTSLEASVSAATTTITAAFTQRMFTVSTVLPQTPGAFFGDAFTVARRQEQIDLGRLGPDNIPVFVSNVVYGRMLMFTFTSTAQEAAIKSTLSAVYNGGEFSASLDAEQRSILENAEISVVAIGGDAENAESLIRTGDLSSYFAQDSDLTTGRPISYTIRNLADNSIARVSETTEYNIKQCLPASVEVTGRRYRITLEDIKFQKGSGGLTCYSCLETKWNYEFRVRQESGTCFAGKGERQQIGFFCEGDFIKIRANESCAERTGDGRPYVEVDLHFDGRDNVRLFGLFKETNWDGPLGDFNWSRQWTGRIPLGNGKIVSTRNCGPLIPGMKMNALYNVQVVSDLTD